MLLQDALAILEQAENAKVRARRTVQEDNHFSIGFVPSAEVNLLPKVLPLFRLKQPDTHIELVSLITTEQEEDPQRRAGRWLNAPPGVQPGSRLSGADS